MKIRASLGGWLLFFFGFKRTFKFFFKKIKKFSKKYDFYKTF